MKYDHVGPLVRHHYNKNIDQIWLMKFLVLFVDVPFFRNFINQLVKQLTTSGHTSLLFLIRVGALYLKNFNF